MKEIIETPDLEAIRQEHDLHGETGIAISTKNLTVRFLELEASTDSLSGSGADLLPNDQQNQSIRTNSNHVTTARTNAQAAGVDGLSQSVSDNAAHP